MKIKYSYEIVNSWNIESIRFSKKQTADDLNISRPTVDNWIKTYRKEKGLKIKLDRLERIEAIIENQTSFNVKQFISLSEENPNSIWKYQEV